MSDPTSSGNGPRIEEIIDLIREFSKQFSQGNRNLTAHFIVSDVVPRDTIYVAHVPRIHLAGAVLPESPSIDETKDYGIIIHRDTLEVVRAEVNKNVPIPLMDNEIAYVLAVGVLGQNKQTPEPPKLRHYGLNTDIS